jgi:farnesyl diphosphate synthase
LTDLKQAMEYVAGAVDKTLASLLPLPAGPEARLLEAVRYGALGAGKRLRPFLVVASGDLFDVAHDFSLRVAAAAEMVHCYSLIHDDLPCMDDADLRRGRPSVHRQYDEATAVLAGDALLTLAFEVLAQPATHIDAEVRTQLVRALAVAAGPAGMVGGQAIDLSSMNHDLDPASITRMQSLKTGAMIGFCCEAGAVLGHADPPKRHALRAYAHDLGLAFQIADDLLDAEGAVQDLGKPVRQDAARGKATLVEVMGADRARAQANMLSEQARRHLDIFGRKAQLLQDLASFVITRRA